MTLIMGTPNKVPLISGNPKLCERKCHVALQRHLMSSPPSLEELRLKDEHNPRAQERTMTATAICFG